MATYGGPTDGAIKINKNLATIKKIDKDSKYFLKVDSDTGNIEVFRQRESGEFGETTENTKIGDYDPRKKKFSHIEGAAIQSEQDLFYDPQHSEQYLVKPAKTILESGLLKDGKVNNPEEATKAASEAIDGTGNLPFTPGDDKAINNNLSTLQEVSKGIARRTYEVLTYPKTLDIKTQDSIKFSLKELTNIKYSSSLNEKPFDRQYTNLEGSVTLPIQSGISDSNLVKWGPDELNAINAAVAGSSLNLMNSDDPNDFVGKFGGMLQDAQKTVFNDSGPFKPAVLAALAGEAVGIQGLVSRATGTVLNPNLELLFQGPQLRPFTFQFRLSPREATEATEVKKIIRFFKQAMSVKTTSSNAFLKTPHVFDIVYQTNGGNIHQSLNRIKTCALLGCDVDYTPDGTYSTFNDAEKTMTSYNLTLRFNELEPIFDKDYEIEGAENFMLLSTLEEEAGHTIGF